MSSDDSTTEFKPHSDNPQSPQASEISAASNTPIIVVLVVLFVFTVMCAWKDISVAFWPSAPGFVTKCYGDTNRAYDCGRNSKYFAFYADYTYRNGNAGRTYKGSTVYRYQTSSQAESEKQALFLKRVPLKIYFNPLEPTQSTRTPTAKLQDFWIKVVFILLPLAVAIMYYGSGKIVLHQER